LAIHSYISEYLLQRPSPWFEIKPIAMRRRSNIALVRRFECKFTNSALKREGSSCKKASTLTNSVTHAMTDLLELSPDAENSGTCWMRFSFFYLLLRGRTRSSFDFDGSSALGMAS
jgi:hypothetical protein